MNIARQHWEFKLRFNKLNSNHYENLNSAKIDALLNAAPIWLIQHYGHMFEEYQFLKDMFSTLVVKFPEQPLLSANNSQITDFIQHEYKLSDLKYPYFHHVQSYAICGNQRIPISIIKHDNSQKFNSKVIKPNYKWKRLLGQIGRSTVGRDGSTGESLYVYSDKQLDKIQIEYLKQPKEVFFGDYDSIEYINCQRNNGSECNQFYNKNDDPVDSELASQYHDFQVDVAVYLASGKTENINLQKLLSSNLIKI